MHNPTQELKSVKGFGNTFELNLRWERTLPSFDILLWVIYRVPPKSKYQSRYLTPCCGLEVHNATQALKSVKGHGNTSDKPQVGKNFGVFRYFLWVIYRISPKYKYQSWCLTPCCWLEVHNPTQALKSVKGLGNTFDLNPMWERTLQSFDIFYGLFIGSPQNPNIKVDI